MTFVTPRGGRSLAVLGGAAERLASGLAVGRGEPQARRAAHGRLAVVSAWGCRDRGRSSSRGGRRRSTLVPPGYSWIVLAATDLDQRRLPHVVLDPLILLAAAFVRSTRPSPRSMAFAGGGGGGFLGALALVVRAGSRSATCTSSRRSA